MFRRLWCLAVLVPLLLAACGSDKSDDTNTSDSSDTPKIQVTISDAGCAPAVINAKPGKTEFAVTNDNSAAVTEFEILSGTKILGEIEGVIPGNEKSFSLTLKPGTFTTYCPNGTKVERGQLVVAAS